MVGVDGGEILSEKESILRSKVNCRFVWLFFYILVSLFRLMGYYKIN